MSESKKQWNQNREYNTNIPRFPLIRPNIETVRKLVLIERAVINSDETEYYKQDVIE